MKMSPIRGLGMALAITMVLQPVLGMDIQELKDNVEKARLVLANAKNEVKKTHERIKSKPKHATCNAYFRSLNFIKESNQALKTKSLREEYIADREELQKLQDKVDRARANWRGERAKLKQAEQREA